MFSVKYVKPDGSETISEFDTVTAEFDGDGRQIVFCHRNQADAPSMQVGPVTQRSPDERAAPAVYVMNRFGATVATYRL